MTKCAYAKKTGKGVLMNVSGHVAPRRTRSKRRREAVRSAVTLVCVIGTYETGSKIIFTAMRHFKSNFGF